MIRKNDYPGFKMPGNDKSKVPKYWLLFDTETTQQQKDSDTVHRFDMGWTCFMIRDDTSGEYKEYWNFWDDERDMNIYIHERAMKTRNIYVLAHNVFFDLQVSGTYGYFSDWGWEMTFIYDQGLTYILRAKNQGATVTFLSSTNWFDVSLEKLGKTLGLEKLDVDFNSSDRETIKTYCRRDVEIIVRAMKYYISFLRQHDLGNFALTKASQAFNGFRHRFKDKKIVIHKNDKAKELERLAYTGGRCEAFRIGEMKGGPFLSLDINSMYPYVMKNNVFPVELIRRGENEPLEKVRDTVKKFGVIGQVEVETEEPVYSVKHGGKTIFPIGRFTCYVTTPGMQYGLEKGHIKRVNQIAVYKMAPLFTGYVDYFYNLKNQYKAEGNTMMSLFTKYMLNSLYGKFGQKKPITEEFTTDTGREYSREEVLNIDTGQVYIITKLMNKMVVQKGEKEGKLSFPGLAAHVTEHGRILLWKIIKSIGPGHVLYCDTDSVKIKASDYHLVNWPMSETDLGALKTEDKTERLYIGGAKYYITDSSRNIKGVPKQAVETEPGSFEFDIFYRQNTHLRNQEDTGVIVGKMTRKLTNAYDKGEVDANGFVRPFRF